MYIPTLWEAPDIEMEGDSFVAARLDYQIAAAGMPLSTGM